MRLRDKLPLNQRQREQVRSLLLAELVELGLISMEKAEERLDHQLWRG